MRMMSISSGAAVAALMLVISACLPTEVCGCQPALPEVTVSGVVLDADKRPVSGVGVVLPRRECSTRVRVG